ncbi:PIN domain-containing protein [Mycobacterium persicum]|uniref:Ribonuclease VapC n=1 Tax=Mycobacterium persicum TaxID=1487726 RepID=A0AB38ULF6_9MYCO|nr:PIN domain-containing protein [Mycobacterium persicum]ORB90263.1 VapC toxin family PIN domain ribonuclease [Mycobacterium persicum]ORC02445.1 VapC toxin family PIN domain ribonuclease [Mycobacterium persicum]VAZ81336.1 23S rRNA-specific endonuclease VapC20 [Mycobacterium persicum]
MIFADTSFWAALGNAKDARHEIAKNLWASKPPVVLTSNHVLGETWTLLNRRRGHRAAVGAAAIRFSAVVRVEHITADLEEQAWDWLARHDEREYSFVDATSFALMRRKGIRNAYAFDDDFSAAGFVELRP